MSPEVEAIKAALAPREPGKGQYAAVAAGDVQAVGRTITSADPVVAALVKGTDPKEVGPGKTVHQRVDDLIHLLTLAGATVTVAELPPPKKGK